MWKVTDSTFFTFTVLHLLEKSKEVWFWLYSFYSKCRQLYVIIILKDCSTDHSLCYFLLYFFAANYFISLYRMNISVLSIVLRTWFWSTNTLIGGPVFPRLGLIHLQSWSAMTMNTGKRWAYNYLLGKTKVSIWVNSHLNKFAIMHFINLWSIQIN